MALTESATHGLSFGEQCEPVVQQIEAARFLISQHGIGRRHEAANTKKLRSAESVVNQGTEFAGRAAGVFQDKERPRRRRPEAFGWMKKECHRGLLQARGRRQSRRCTSNRTRPISWLGSISSGTHPRTKGARCFTGGRRDRIPSTPRSLLAAREARRQETLRRERKNRGARESRRRDSRTNCLLALRPHVTGRTRTPSQKGSRAWEAPQGAGRMPRHRGSGRRGRRVFRRQDALGDARRLRGAGRLPVEDSTGSVPLQSG